MSTIINEVSRTIASRWRARSFDAAAFPELAARALTELALHRNVDSIHDHVFDTSDRPVLEDHGNPVVIPVFRDPDFDVFLHAYVGGLVEIHHHRWAGAFQVLQGTSVDGTHRFHEARRLDAGFALGELELLHAERLTAGATCTVVPGPSFIHALSYDDATSLSISVRSRRPSGSSSMSYWRPGLAIEPRRAAAHLRGRQKLLRQLAHADEGAARARLHRWMVEDDLQSAFHALEAAALLPRPLPGLGELVDHGRRVHGEDFETIAAAAEDIRNKHAHEAVRQGLRGPEEHLRSFLSCTFVCPDRESIARLMATSFPDEPTEDLICRLCHRLLVEGSDPGGEGWRAGLAPVIRHLLRAGSSPAPRAPRSAAAPKLERIHAALRTHPLLGPLFRPSERR